MKHTHTNIQDLASFASAFHLYPTVEAVVEHKLKNSGQPIPTIKAVQFKAMLLMLHPMMQVVWKLLCVAKPACVMQPLGRSWLG